MRLLRDKLGHRARVLARTMNWVLKVLGYRDREYRGGDLFVRIEPIHREAEEPRGFESRRSGPFLPLNSLALSLSKRVPSSAGGLSWVPKSFSSA